MATLTGSASPTTATTTPASPAASIGVTAENIAELREASRVIDSFSAAMKESVGAGTEYRDNLIDLERQFNALKSSVGDFNKNFDGSLQKSQEFDDNLKKQISTLKQYSSLLEGEVNKRMLDLQADMESLAKTQESVKASSDIFSGIDLEAITDTAAKINELKEAIRLNETAMRADAETTDKLTQTHKLLSESMKAGKEITEEDIKNSLKAQGLDETKVEYKNQLILLLQKEAVELKGTTEGHKKYIVEAAKGISITEMQLIKSDWTEKNKKYSEELVKNIASGENWLKFFGTSILNASNGMKVLGQTIGQGLTSAFVNPQKAIELFAGFMDKFVIKSTFEFDKNIAAINKSTGGMGREFEEIATKKIGPFTGTASAGLARYGLGLNDLGQSFTALNKGIAGFNQLGDQNRKILMDNAAAATTLGTTYETFTSIARNSMGALNKTVEGVNTTISTLQKNAIAAGKDIGEYVSQFDKLFPKLMSYGREATEIFRELSALSTMTKGIMSAEDLESFADKFSTWDSAAENISKFNAALGGTSIQIDDMMRAANENPADALRMLHSAFKESGIEFESLNRGYKKLLAEPFGGDVSKAASFFKNDISLANAELAKMKASEKELEERRLKSASAQQKINAAIDNMRIAFTPIISIVGGIAEIFSKYQQILGPVTAVLSVAMPLAITALFSWWKFKIVETGIAFKSMFANVSSDITAIAVQMGAVTAEAVAARTAVAGVGATSAATSVTAAAGGALLPAAAGATGVGATALASKPGMLAKAGKFIGGNYGKIITALITAGMAYGAYKSYSSDDSINAAPSLSIAPVTDTNPVNGTAAGADIKIPNTKNKEYGIYNTANVGMGDKRPELTLKSGDFIQAGQNPDNLRPSVSNRMDYDSPTKKDSMFGIITSIPLSVSKMIDKSWEFIRQTFSMSSSSKTDTRDNVRVEGPRIEKSKEIAQYHAERTEASIARLEKTLSEKVIDKPQQPIYLSLSGIEVGMRDDLSNMIVKRSVDAANESAYSKVAVV